MNIKSVKTVEYVYEVTMVTEVFPVSHVVFVETRLLELQCGRHGSAVTSSDGSQSKSAGVSLPKRAETFTAFDSKQKTFGT